MYLALPSLHGFSLFIDQLLRNKEGGGGIFLNFERLSECVVNTYLLCVLIIA